jgi:hypothetical protein
MDYHALHGSEYGVLIIPPDASALRNIKERWPIFKEEPRNVRISLEANADQIWGSFYFNGPVGYGPPRGMKCPSQQYPFKCNLLLTQRSDLPRRHLYKFIGTSTFFHRS